MSLPSPYFSRDAKHSYKSHSLGRHELLLLKPFSQKAPRSYIKTLLLQGITISYKSPSLRRHNYFLHKTLLLEGTYTPYKQPFSWKTTIFITSQQLKEHCQRGNSFKCMIKGTNLTSPYTQLGILSLPPVAPIFSLQS